MPCPQPVHHALEFLAALVLATPVCAQGYLCAEGGGRATSTGWGAEVYGWALAKGGFGSVVVLGVGATDADAAETFRALGASSVTELAVAAADANLASVEATIAGADVVWIGHGETSEYVLHWDGTACEAAIRAVHGRGGVVGGSGAGAAVLGEIVYDAFAGSVPARAALEDPYDPRITFTEGFLALGPELVIDPHFTDRGRLGRLAAFVPRLAQDLGREILGVGIDDRTALCVGPDGTAEVRGEGAVTLLSRGETTRQVIVAGEAVVATDLVHTQLVEGYVVDLATRTVVARPANAIASGPATAPAAFHFQTLSGDSASDAQAGDLQVLDSEDPDALVHGRLVVDFGNADVLRGIVVTRVWGGEEQVENRVGGLQYALAQNPHWLGLYLDEPVRVSTTASGFATVETPVGGSTPLVVLDTSGVTTTAFSRYVSSSASVGPRQSVALESARLHVLRPGTRYDATTHAAFFTTLFGVGKTNSLGVEAFLIPSGTPAVSTDDFTIASGDGVPFAPAILLQGTASASTPFAGGTLYVGGSLVRFPVHVLDGAGATSYSIPVVPAAVGVERFFQLWYRDTALADGTGVALSDALRVLFAL